MGEGCGICEGEDTMGGGEEKGTVSEVSRGEKLLWIGDWEGTKD